MTRDVSPELAPGHSHAELARLASLIRVRNSIDAQIAELIDRPASLGHLGEWIASRVFDIELSASATERDVDGRFRAGALQARTVNIKLYGKRENTLDLKPDGAVDFYLVLAGPRGYAVSSRGTTRPLCIASVHLFETGPLIETLAGRGLGIGVATSVRQEFWDAAEVFPAQRSGQLTITETQREMLTLFAPE